MTQRYDVLIVGAGHGGAHAATVLRQRKFEGTIAIVGDEPELPYERPPLSKEYFSGERTFERILIRPEAFWAERQVTFHLGRRVMAIDSAAHQVLLDDGTAIGYGHLVWATGGSARRLTCQGHDLGGVHAVRTRAHVDAMMGELDRVTNVVVIGGGYIGLEAAAVLTKFGKRVTVLETMNRVLARVAGEALSRFYEAEHRAHGVDVRLGETASHIEGDNGWVTGVQLVSGDLLPAQMVIVGIGIIPAVGPLLDADAAGGNGVFVDEYCRTSLPDIFAIGDCAAHANHFADGAIIRLESVQNATDQAGTVAKAITGSLEPYQATPWFWSNQYDLKLQTVGLSTGFDETFIHGDPATKKFSIVYLKHNHVLALDCVNNAKDFVQGKTIIGREARNRPEFAASGDPIKALAG